MTDIFSRIREDMQGAPASDRLQDTIRLVSIALSDESEFRRQHEAAAANPLIETAAAEAAAGDIARAVLKEQRLQAGLKLLDGKLVEALAAERQAERLAVYDAMQVKRDDLVAEFRRTWGKHVKPLVAMLDKLRDLDAEVSSVETPADRDALDTAEVLLNDAPQHRDPRYPGVVVWLRPSLLDFVRLPAIKGADAPAWNHEADRKTTEAEAAQRARWVAGEIPDRVMLKSVSPDARGLDGRNEWVA